MFFLFFLQLHHDSSCVQKFYYGWSKQGNLVLIHLPFIGLGRF